MLLLKEDCKHFLGQNESRSRVGGIYYLIPLKNPYYIFYTLTS